MTDNIHMLKQLVSDVWGADNVVEVKYEMLGGETPPPVARSVRLLNIPDDVAVQHIVMPPGEFKRHSHPISREYGIVHRGRVVVQINGKERGLSRGDYIVFEPGTPHGGEVLEECHMIFTTIPPDKGYP